MPKIKILARNWGFEVTDDPTGLSPDWVRIGGINSFTISNDKEDTDVTDFDSDGSTEHVVAGRTTEIVVEGHYIEDDPGQMLFDDIAERIGDKSIAGFRVIRPSGYTDEYFASFGPGDVGGGNNDVTSWGGSVTRSGKINNIVNANEVGFSTSGDLDGGVV
jgi:hypothetical protein